MATSKEDGNTDEFAEKFCDPCKIDNEHAVTVSYCEECNQHLCRHCNKVHKRLAVSRNHTVKEKEELQAKLDQKTIVTEIPEKCIAHPTQVIAHYCASHNEICCSQCLSLGHKICNDVKSVTDYLNNFDRHEEEKKLKSKMRTLAEEVSETLTLVQASLNVVERCHDEAQSRMLEAKRSAFDHIESLYDTLIDKLNKMRQKDLEMILPYRFKCNAILFDMNTLENHFSCKTKYSKKQLFFAIRKADAKVDSICHELSEIKDDKHLSVTRYRFIPDAQITDLKTNPSTFGSLNVQNDAIKSAAKLYSLSNKDEKDDQNCRITGLTLVSNNRLVVADNLNLSVKVIDIQENKVISSIKLESAPWDVTSVASNTVSVTIPEKKVVEFLSIDENSTFDIAYEKRMTCPGKCYGIAKYKDTILVTVIQEKKGAKLEKYDLKGKLLLSAGIKTEKPQYIICHYNQSRIYISNARKSPYGYQSIEVLKSEDFTQLSELTLYRNSATGMATDKAGLLYYCDSTNHEIDLVDLNQKEKERKRQFLIMDKTPNPKCLVFCNETSRLFVGLDGNEIGVYNVF